MTLINRIVKLLLIIFLFGSCKKETNTQNSEKVELIFSVGGVNIANKASNNIKSSSNEFDYQEKSKVKTINIDNIGLDISSETKEMNSSENYNDKTISKEIISDKRGQLKALTSPMESNKTYRIILRNTSNNTIEHTALATVGTNTAIVVNLGDTYTYYAYSYNNSEQIDDPSSLGYIIDTPTDKDLLYTTGTITMNNRTELLSLVFDHMLAEIAVEMDYDRLFGTITDEEMEFSEDYLYTGKFNITSGTTNNIVIKPNARSIVFTETDPVNQIRTARHYTANPSTITTIKVNINQLEATHIDNSIVQLTPAPREETFGPYTAPAVGKQLIAKIKLWRRFTNKTVLHIAANTEWGYSAGHAASFNMLHDNKNYGTDPISLSRFKLNPGQTAFTSNIIIQGDDQIIPGIATHSPDIIILAFPYNLKEAEAVELLRYINAGGVLINFADQNSPDPTAVLLRGLFDEPGIIVERTSSTIDAYVYSFSNMDNEILNGAFGDMRGKHWGADGNHAMQALNVPTADITLYSAKIPENTGSGDLSTFDGVNMFKHNIKSFFWIGDGGFLSSGVPNGTNNQNNVRPFTTVRTESDVINEPNGRNFTQLLNTINPNPIYNYTNFPHPKANYGRGYTNDNSFTVYNSTFFANVMSWAVVSSEFFGYNSGGLPAIPINY